VRRGRGYSFEGSDLLSQGLKNTKEGKGTLWGKFESQVFRKNVKKHRIALTFQVLRHVTLKMTALQSCEALGTVFY